MKIQNYYTILNLSQESSCEQLYQECKDLFLKYHPQNVNSEETFRKFIAVNDAYSVLLKTEIRSKYDYLLEKYAEDSKLDRADKITINEIMNLILEQRKRMKKTLASDGSTFISLLVDVPLSFSNHDASLDTNLLDGLSFPDLAVNLDFDFNIFDFFDSN